MNLVQIYIEKSNKPNRLKAIFNTDIFNIFMDEKEIFSAAGVSKQLLKIELEEIMDELS